MEHLCHRCGSPVDESSPFCPNCDAPQVHFSAAENARQPVVVSATPQLLVATEPHISAPSGSFRTEGRLRSAATAGIAAGLLGILPLGIIFGSALAGVLAVVFYRRRSLRGDLASGEAFKLGSLSGLFGFLIFVGLHCLDVVVSHSENEIRDNIIENVHRQQAWNTDPQARQILEYFLTPHGIIAVLVVGVVMAGIVFILFSGLTASIAASLLRRRDR